MTLCDMCGKNESSVIALIERTEMGVCQDCAKFGKIVRRISPILPISKKVKKQTEKEPEEEIIETIIAGYGKIIKDARERLGLNQEDFGKKLNEKVSIIHNLESEHHEPNIDLAKKLEKLLRIKLVLEEKLEKVSFGKKDSGQITIGDIIKIR